MRVPWDNQWGTSTASGNWTGIVGTLQHHKADFSMMLSWMETRLPIVDYSRIYLSEPLVMITLKPLPLSQAFALVRPFSGEDGLLRPLPHERYSSEGFHRLKLLCGCYQMRLMLCFLK